MCCFCSAHACSCECWMSFFTWRESLALSSSYSDLNQSSHYHMTFRCRFCTFACRYIKWLGWGECLNQIQELLIWYMLYKSMRKSCNIGIYENPCRIFGGFSYVTAYSFVFGFLGFTRNTAWYCWSYSFIIVLWMYSFSFLTGLYLLEKAQCTSTMHGGRVVSSAQPFLIQKL